MDADELSDRLTALPSHIQRWLRVDRNQVCGEVIQTVLDAFTATPSPEEREGIETGLDFLGVLKSEGSDNALWQVGMDQLESEIYSAVAALDEDEQVALLLPWVDDLDDLGTDVPPEDWGDCLRRSCEYEWVPVLRRLVMAKL